MCGGVRTRMRVILRHEVPEEKWEEWDVGACGQLVGAVGVLLCVHVHDSACLNV